MEIMKISNTKTKFQINPNDPSSKFQKGNPFTVVPNDIITGRTGFGKQDDTTMVNYFHHLQFLIPPLQYPVPESPVPTGATRSASGPARASTGAT